MLDPDMLESRFRLAVPAASPNHSSSLTDSIYYIPNFITEAEERQLLHNVTSQPASRWTTLSRRRLQAWPSQLTASNVLLTSDLPTWLTDPIFDRWSACDLFSGSRGNSDGQSISSTASSSTLDVQPNHVLINEYQPGQGIFPHRDGEAYYGTVATISLGDNVVLDIQAPSSQPTPRKNDLDDDDDHENDEAARATPTNEPSTCSQSTKILQEPRSLLITTGPAYRDTMHGIAETTVDHDLSTATVANWTLLDPNLREKIDREGGSLLRSRTRTSLTYRRVLKTSNLAKRLFGPRKI